MLLPARNAAGTLGSCLDSLRRQTEPDWECVLVDDGSTDGTVGLIRRLAGDEPRLRLVRSPSRGLVPALNLGLAHCRGRYVARMDADDLMRRRRLERQCALLDARPALCGAGCHVRIFPRASMGPGLRQYEAWLNAVRDERCLRRELFVECPVAHPTLVLRREVLMAAGYRDRGWPEDYDLLMRLVLDGQPVGVLPERLLAWRHSDLRLSRTAPAYAPERFTACKAAFLASSFLAGTDRYLLWGYGHTGRTLRRELERAGKRPSHVIEVHPGRLGHRIHGAPVVPPQRLPELPRHPLVVSVAGAGPRRQIRAALAEMGRCEMIDFVCAA